MPLLIAAATRPPEGEGRDPTLVAELMADPEVVAIRPEPLGCASIGVLARELHGLEPDEAFCAALETATGGNPLFVGAVLDAVAREGISPTAEQAPRLLELGAQGVSRAVGLRLARLPSEALALLRAASILGDGAELRHAAALAGVKAASLARRPQHSFGSTCSGARIRSSSSTRSSAAPSTRPSMSSNETPPTTRPLSCCSRTAPGLKARRGISCASPPGGHVRGLDAPPGGRALARAGRGRGRGRISDPCARGADRSAARAEVLVELGFAERRTNGPAAADHLRAGLELLADRSRRCAVALELGRALWFTDRIGDALAVFQQALDEMNRERDPDLYELLVAELISSAWWDAQTYPIAEAAIGGLDLDALKGASAARCCSRRWRTTSSGWRCTASARSSSPGARSRPGTCWPAARLRSITR